MTEAADLFAAMNEAEAALLVSYSVVKEKQLDAAQKRYFAALNEARAVWASLPDGDAKCSAEENANDTLAEGEFDRANDLAWLQCAITTYHLNS